MFGSVLLLAIMAQDTGALTAPPTVRESSDCICPSNVAPEVTLSGYVIDAQIILGANRRSVEDRMATIFDVKSSSSAKISGRTKVWHNVSDDACGVTFDYGKKYTVRARWSEDNQLETDACLMGG